MAITFLVDQPGLPGMCPIADAVERLANDSDHSERGAIFTRREVVDFMLDLAGYTADRPLHQMRLLEPSFGGGEFLLAAVERLLVAFKSAGGNGDLADCIRAVELHGNTYRETRAEVIGLLERSGLGPAESRRLGDCWLVHGDFLLSALPGQFHFIVGNPPYVRQELIPPALLAEYRRRYASLYDRADLSCRSLSAHLVCWRRVGNSRSFALTAGRRTNMAGRFAPSWRRDSTFGPMWTWWTHPPSIQT